MPTTEGSQYKHLSAQQLERVDALHAARSVVVSRKSGMFAGTSAADPIDLVNLARYITTGTDPYEVTREAAETAVREAA